MKMEINGDKIVEIGQSAKIGQDPAPIHMIFGPCLAIFSQDQTMENKRKSDSLTSSKYWEIG